MILFNIGQSIGFYMTYNILLIQKGTVIQIDKPMKFYYIIQYTQN